jgi:hypothetical protein
MPRMGSVALSYAGSVPARNRDLSRDSRCRHRGEKRLNRLRRALLDMSIPLANFGAVDQYLRAMERAGNALSQVSEGDTQKWTWLRALYLNRRLCAGKWHSGEMEECRKLVANLCEAGNRRLLGEVQQGFGYVLLLSSKYREANRKRGGGFCKLARGLRGEPLSEFFISKRMNT